VNGMLKRMAVSAGLIGLMLVSALPVAAADEARVRVLHASPDAPAVDIYLDDAMVDALTNVPFGTLSDYLAIPAGEHNIKVYATGDNTTPVIDATASFDADTSYTVAAVGAVADIAPAIFVDDPALTEESALVRVIHLSPDAPAVDVAPDGAAPADAVVKGLEFPDATDYLALPPASYDLEVRLAGTTDVALQLDPVEVAGGSAYTVFAIGSAGDPALGGNALSALVAFDGKLLPDTATVVESPAPGVDWLMIAIVMVVGVTAFSFFARTFATQRR
jgi:hypothetical protein